MRRSRRWCSGCAGWRSSTDAPLERAAADALAKIAAVLPDDLRERVADVGLHRRAGSRSQTAIDLAPMRAAIRTEHKVVLDDADKQGERTRRTIWPIAIGFFERTRVIAAWCELRADFRHFRTDRIAALRLTGQALSATAPRADAGNGARAEGISGVRSDC